MTKSINCRAFIHFKNTVYTTIIKTNLAQYNLQLTKAGTTDHQCRAHPKILLCHIEFFSPFEFCQHCLNFGIRTNLMFCENSIVAAAVSVRLIIFSFIRSTPPLKVFFFSVQSFAIV